MTKWLVFSLLACGVAMAAFWQSERAGQRLALDAFPGCDSCPWTKDEFDHWRLSKGVPDPGMAMEYGTYLRPYRRAHERQQFRQTSVRNTKGAITWVIVGCIGVVVIGLLAGFSERSSNS